MYAIKHTSGILLDDKSRVPKLFLTAGEAESYLYNSLGEENISYDVYYKIVKVKLKRKWF